jgi:hypothetical protein
MLKIVDEKVYLLAGRYYPWHGIWFDQESFYRDICPLCQREIKREEGCQYAFIETPDHYKTVTCRGFL